MNELEVLGIFLVITKFLYEHEAYATNTDVASYTHCTIGRTNPFHYRRQ